MKPTVVKCPTCLFFNAQIKSCCYNPPLAVPLMSQAVAGGRPRLDAGSIFPPVLPDWWCGKYQPIQYRETDDAGNNGQATAGDGHRQVPPEQTAQTQPRLVENDEDAVGPLHEEN